MGSRVTVSVAFGEKVVELSGEVVRHVERGKGRTGVGVTFVDAGQAGDVRKIASALSLQAEFSAIERKAS